MWTVDLCSCLILNDHHCMAWSDQLVLWIMESTKVNKPCNCSIRSQQSIPFTLHKVHGVQVHLIMESTYWRSLHVSLNHHLTPLHSYYIHSMNDNVHGGWMCIYTHSHFPLVLDILLVPTKLAQRSTFRLSIIVLTEGIQTSLLCHWLLPNTDDEQVLGAVHVALRTDTYQGTIISADLHIFKQAATALTNICITCMSLYML